MVLVHAAVGDTDGNITIYDVPGRSDNAAIGEKAATQNLGAMEKRALTVPIVSLDTYLDGAAPELRMKIAFIKIDVQGSELLVLRGMRRLLKTPPTPAMLGGYSFVVKAEYDPSLQASSGHKAGAMLQYMHELGYEMRCGMSDDQPLPMDKRPNCPDVFFSKGKPLLPT